MKSDEIVYWMLKKLGRSGKVSLVETVCYLYETQSFHLLGDVEEGKLALSSELQVEFRESVRDTVVWVASDGCWCWK